MNEVHQKAYEEFKEYLISQNPDYDFKTIEKAFELCLKAHEGQTRFSKEEYYIHPLNVAEIVASLGLDTAAVCAALLHDTVEDTFVTVEDLRKEFGTEIAELVDGVTKINKLSFVSKEEMQAENLRKMLIAMGKDIRVILVKLADRLHNMRTIDYMFDYKQREKALETLEVYAPIAHRLGIRSLKEELEDISIAHLDPIAYKQIEDLLSEKKEFSMEVFSKIEDRIMSRLHELMPETRIEFQSRVKSIHGIYRKMFIQGRDFEEIYDIYAVRIITESVADCYNILGVVHDMFRPIPNRFKDYISTPKPNMYQSLHTTVLSREGLPFEIQIRTFDMHVTAEYGIAAHWKYKEGINRNDDKLENRLAWIRQILESGDSNDASELLRSIKVDLAQDDVFAVTPKGDVINLPAGSTIVDFAFAIHSQVGIRMVGAKVDGRIVPISHEVKTGEVIEILTTNQVTHGPSRDWINIAVTNQAKTKIRNWFKKEKRTENIAAGKQETEKEFKRNGIVFDTDEEYEAFVGEVAKKQKFNDTEEFFAAVGYGGIILSKILQRIKEDYQKLLKEKEPPAITQVKAPSVSKSGGVIVEGVDNCLIKFAKCCAPLPGDEIIGFITRGHGVSIHKRDCNNVPKDIAASAEPDRWLPARWAKNQRTSFLASLIISGVDREGLIVDISQVIFNMHLPLHALNAKSTKDGNSEVLITVSTEGKEHLQSVIAKLEKVNGVYSIERLNR